MISRRSFCTLLGGTCLAALAFAAGCSGAQGGSGSSSGSSGSASAGSSGAASGQAAQAADDGAAQGKKVSLVTTQAEALPENAAWVGTVQLCWNSVVETVNDGQKMQFDQGNTLQVDALNDKLFDATMLSDDHFYTYTGVRSTAAKAQIEQAIHDKFDQESDILDLIEWLDDPAPTDLIAYAMLYRVFEFEHAFDVVDDGSGTFAAGTDAAAEGVTYFGVDGESKDELRRQVNVLYYEDEGSFAVELPTKQDDYVIAVKGATGDTVDDIFQAAMLKADSADPAAGRFEDIDTLKVPNLDIDELVEYKTLSGLTWTTPAGDDMRIDAVVQTLKFELNNKGGKIKSEAAIMLEATSIPREQPEPRAFHLDGPFALFLVDGNAEANTAGDDGVVPFSALKPYFGVKVDDITKFQSDAARAGDLVEHTETDPPVSESAGN